MSPLGDHAGVAPASRTPSAIASAALVGACVRPGSALGAAELLSVVVVWPAAGVLPGDGWCAFCVGAAVEIGSVALGRDGVDWGARGVRVARGVPVGPAGFTLGLGVEVGAAVGCWRGCFVCRGSPDAAGWAVAAAELARGVRPATAL